MPTRNEKFNIYERIFNFILLVLKFVEKLPNTYSNQVIKNQISRSAPSMGANSEEADGTNSRRDFIHCFTTVRKECKETVFWLRLVEKLNPTLSDDAMPIIQEGKEISLILTTIIKNTIINAKK